MYFQKTRSTLHTANARVQSNHFCQYIQNGLWYRLLVDTHQIQRLRVDFETPVEPCR